MTNCFGRVFKMVWSFQKGSSTYGCCSYFYRDALISVLDEPTSAIDAVTEEKIFEMLETKMDGRTVVLISHRFSTVKNADKIAVIEHGELKRDWFS